MGACKTSAMWMSLCSRIPKFLWCLFLTPVTVLIVHKEYSIWYHKKNQLPCIFLGPSLYDFPKLFIQQLPHFPMSVPFRGLPDLESIDCPCLSFSWALHHCEVPYDRYTTYRDHKIMYLIWFSTFFSLKFKNSEIQFWNFFIFSE